MAANPQFTSMPVSPSFVLATANLNRDGVTGAVVTAYTFRSAANGGTGGLLEAISLCGLTGATVAGIVLLYKNNSIVREISVTAITPAATVKGFNIPVAEGADSNGLLRFDRLQCLAGDIIKVQITTTQNVGGFLLGGEF